MKSKKNTLDFRKLVSRPEFSTFAILLVMLVITAVLQPNFFSARTIRSNINSFTPLILLAMGQAVVVISGGLDLSSGTSMAMLLCIMTQIMDSESPITGVWAILAALLMAVVVGLVNGISVGYLKLPPVIATFATSYIWLGIALFVTPTPGGQIVGWFKIFYDLSAVKGIPAFLGGVPTAIFLILLACLVWYVISKTRTGRYIYAVGSSRENAYASGIKAAKTQTIAYVINALFIFLCALYFAGQNGAGSAHIGDPLTLQAIAAAVVGGVAMSGGRGSVFFAIAGAIIMSLVARIIFLVNVPNAYQTFVSGIIVIFAISTSVLYSWIRKRTMLKEGQ